MGAVVCAAERSNHVVPGAMPSCVLAERHVGRLAGKADLRAPPSSASGAVARCTRKPRHPLLRPDATRSLTEQSGTVGNDWAPNGTKRNETSFEHPRDATCLMSRKHTYGSLSRRFRRKWPDSGRGDGKAAARQRRVSPCWVAWSARSGAGHAEGRNMARPKDGLTMPPGQRWVP